jgi:hypothetical protein
MTGHLIHIGYPKTGSNFLRRWFSGHPQLAYAHGGLAGYQDVYRLVRDAAAPPAQQTRYRVTSSEAFATPTASFGEIGARIYDEPPVPMETAQASACELLADLFPNAKVLVVTRGFRSAIPSMYSQTVRGGITHTFEEFCARLETAVRERRDGWDYCRLLGLYRKRFGDENVITLPYELLRDDAPSFTAALETRLGLERFTVSGDRVNVSLSPVELYWYPRLSRLAGRFGSGRIGRAYARAVFNNRLRLPIRLLQRLRPGAPLNLAGVPESLVDAYRGRADCLRGKPYYAPYAADYLW